MAHTFTANLIRLLALTGLLSLLLAGCSSTTPAPVYGWNWSGPVPQGYYLVRGGDSLGLIAQRLGIPADKLARWNHLRPPYTVYADTLLRVTPPGGPARSTPPRTAGQAPAKSRPRQEPVPEKEVVPEKEAVERPGAAAPTRAASGDERRERAANAGTDGSRRVASGIDWRWPLDGVLVQRFREGDRIHQGIRLEASPGDEVRAASDGRVVYSGSGLKGYGNLIIIKHNDKYLSAYGFNRKLFVAEGERVKRGQVVAEVGQRAAGIYVLHFEIRRDGVAVDPLLYLPPRD